MGEKVRSWVKCGALRGIFRATAMLCLPLAFISTPIEYRITPDRELNQVIEILYCKRANSIDIIKYIQEQNTNKILGEIKHEVIFLGSTEEQHE